jgi:hypothetical protein
VKSEFLRSYSEWLRICACSIPAILTLCNSLNPPFSKYNCLRSFTILLFFCRHSFPDVPLLYNKLFPNLVFQKNTDLVFLWSDSFALLIWDHSYGCCLLIAYGGPCDGCFRLQEARCSLVVSGQKQELQFHWRLSHRTIPLHFIGHICWSGILLWPIASPDSRRWGNRLHL